MELFVLIFILGSIAIVLFYAAIGYSLLGFALMIRRSRQIYWEVHGRSTARARVHTRVLAARARRQQMLHGTP